MGWKENKSLKVGREIVSSLQRNNLCFVRKNHNCEKIFEGSKSCFIACPSDENIELILELISEKLTNKNIEPVIAIRDRAYGQDIFCTKICGKILESKFCIVILDDSTKISGKSKVNIPNPNVYYEYGLMTALGKYVIPLQKEDLKLAFNIQSYDTILYNNSNLGIELDRAIQDAIELTVLEPSKEIIDEMDVISILRLFEFAGFVEERQYASIRSIYNDTNFKFLQSRNSTLLLGKIDTQDEIKTHLEDLKIITHRKKKVFDQQKSEISKLENEIKSDYFVLVRDIDFNDPDFLENVTSNLYTRAIKLETLLNEISQIKKDFMNVFLPKSNTFIGILHNPDIDNNDLKELFNNLLKNKPFTLAIQENNKMILGSIEIDLEIK